MENNSVVAESNRFRIKIGEVIQGSVDILEKGTINIFKELNRMRDEYSTVINKCMHRYHY